MDTIHAHKTRSFVMSHLHESWVTIGIILWMSGSPGLFPGLLLQTWNWEKDRSYEAGSCEGVDSGERNVGCRRSDRPWKIGIGMPKD